MTPTSDLARWRAAWQALGITEPPAALFQELQDHYNESRRAYHTMAHIRECLAQFDRVRRLAARPAEVEMAIWFHDAIYDPQQADNEERSAQWAETALAAAGVESEIVQRVAEFILCTKHERAPESADAALLLDIDLAILGADAERFDVYELQIRQEYAWVPWPQFRRSRAAILRRFLHRPAIYHTEHFAQCLEERARANLHRSLGRL